MCEKDLDKRVAQLKEEMTERQDWTIKKSAFKLKASHIEIIEHEKIVFELEA